jgi:hypothetical protein
MDIGKLDSAELMRASLPPTESNLPLQLLNFLWNLSTITLQSLLEILRGLFGIPKYLKGIAPSLHPNKVT